jgi:hypothetical protein
MKKLILLCCVALGSVGFVGAQDISDLIRGSQADANYLFKGYTGPVLSAFGAGLNQGWYNTAKPHKKFGVDFTISVAAIGLPESANFFKVDNSKLTSMQMTFDHAGQPVEQGTGIGKAPTIVGPGSTNSKYELNGVEFDGPDGKFKIGDLPMDRMPVPVYHLAIGLPKGTEIKLRVLPAVGAGDFKMSMYGAGVLHDVKQYIPGIKLVPFDLSAFVGYTNFKFSLDNIHPTNTSQKIEFDATAITVQALVSKKISVVTVYGGVGYNHTKVGSGAKGNYDLDDDGVNDTKDPVDFSITESGLRATAGLRLKLAVFTFHGDYTLQKYSAFTAGFGISVR